MGAHVVSLGGSRAPRAHRRAPSGVDDVLLALADVDPVANPAATLATAWAWGAVLAVCASLLHGHAAVVLALCALEPAWPGTGAGAAAAAECEDPLLAAMHSTRNAGSNTDSLFGVGGSDFAALGDDAKGGEGEGEGRSAPSEL